MRKFLEVLTLALPLVGAIVTGVAVAYTDYPQQVVEAQAQKLLLHFGSVERVSPTLFSMSPVVAVHGHDAWIDMAPLTLVSLTSSWISNHI